MGNQCLVTQLIANAAKSKERVKSCGVEGAEDDEPGTDRKDLQRAGRQNRYRSMKTQSLRTKVFTADALVDAGSDARTVFTT